MMFVSIIFYYEILSRIALLANDGVEVVVRCIFFVFVLDGVVYFVTVLSIEWYIMWNLFVLKL